MKKPFNKKLELEGNTANEKVKGTWLKSPWGKKYYVHPDNVRYYLDNGFTETTPDETLAPWEEPLMVKDSSVTELYKKWLAEQGLVNVDVNVSFTLKLRNEHLPLAMMLKISSESTPEQDPFKMQERAAQLFDLMSKNYMAPLDNE
jgi:hypothetical protein